MKTLIIIILNIMIIKLKLPSMALIMNLKVSVVLVVVMLRYGRRDCTNVNDENVDDFCVLDDIGSRVDFYVTDNIDVM